MPHAPNIFWPGRSPVEAAPSYMFPVPSSPGTQSEQVSLQTPRSLPAWAPGLSPAPSHPTPTPPQHWFCASVWAEMVLARLEKGIISVSLHSSQPNSQNGKWPRRASQPPAPGKEGGREDLAEPGERRGAQHNTTPASPWSSPVVYKNREPLGCSQAAACAQRPLGWSRAQ